MDAKLVYEEAGRNYRYFADWRNKIVAGYLTVLGALGFAFLGAKTAGLQIAILLAAIPLSVVFWIFDVRNRELLHACLNAGATLETNGRILGSHHELNSPPRGRLTHNLGINILVASVLAASSSGLVFRLSLLWAHRQELVIPLFVFLGVFVGTRPWKNYQRMTK